MSIKSFKFKKIFLKECETFLKQFADHRYGKDNVHFPIEDVIMYEIKDCISNNKHFFDEITNENLKSMAFGFVDQITYGMLVGGGPKIELYNTPTDFGLDLYSLCIYILEEAVKKGYLDKEYLEPRKQEIKNKVPWKW